MFENVNVSTKVDKALTFYSVRSNNNNLEIIKQKLLLNRVNIFEFVYFW